MKLFDDRRKRQSETRARGKKSCGFAEVSLTKRGNCCTDGALSITGCGFGQNRRFLFNDLRVTGGDWGLDNGSVVTVAVVVLVLKVANFSFGSDKVVVSILFLASGNVVWEMVFVVEGGALVAAVVELWRRGKLRVKGSQVCCEFRLWFVVKTWTIPLDWPRSAYRQERERLFGPTLWTEKVSVGCIA